MTNTTMTPYAGTKIVNGWLAKAGVDKKLPPQMIYTYVAKGYIASYETDELDSKGEPKKVVDEAQLLTWFVKYATKNNIDLTSVVDQPVVNEVDENQLDLFEDETVEA
jgi:hypothetical protein